MMDRASLRGRSAESDAERAARLEEKARKISADGKAEQDAMDAAVRRSIKLHGA